MLRAGRENPAGRMDSGEAIGIFLTFAALFVKKKCQFKQKYFL